MDHRLRTREEVGGLFSLLPLRAGQQGVSVASVRLAEDVDLVVIGSPDGVDVVPVFRSANRLSRRRLVTGPFSMDAEGYAARLDGYTHFLCVR